MAKTASRVDEIDLGENPLALDRQVCFALAVASRSVIGIYRPLLEPMGLTHPAVPGDAGALGPRAALGQGHRGDAAPGAGDALADAQAPGVPGLHQPPAQRAATSASSPSSSPRPAGPCAREAEKIPYAVVRRLGMTVDDLMALHGALGQRHRRDRSRTGVQAARRTIAAGDQPPDEGQRLRDLALLRRVRDRMDREYAAAPERRGAGPRGPHVGRAPEPRSSRRPTASRPTPT